MKSRVRWGRGLSNGKTYKINLDNEDIENEYFKVHDKVLWDCFQLSSGEIKRNETAIARAFYGEKHAAREDQCVEFSAKGRNVAIWNSTFNDWNNKSSNIGGFQSNRIIIMRHLCLT